MRELVNRRWSNSESLALRFYAIYIEAGHKLSIRGSNRYMVEFIASSVIFQKGFPIIAFGDNRIITEYSSLLNAQTYLTTGTTTYIFVF